MRGDAELNVLLCAKGFGVQRGIIIDGGVVRQGDNDCEDVSTAERHPAHQLDV